MYGEGRACLKHTRQCSTATIAVQELKRHVQNKLSNRACCSPLHFLAWCSTSNNIQCSTKAACMATKHTCFLRLRLSYAKSGSRNLPQVRAANTYTKNININTVALWPCGLLNQGRWQHGFSIAGLLAKRQQRAAGHAACANPSPLTPSTLQVSRKTYVMVPPPERLHLLLKFEHHSPTVSTACM